LLVGKMLSRKRISEDGVRFLIHDILLVFRKGRYNF
jgi:hypothetical protein